MDGKEGTDRNDAGHPACCRVPAWPRVLMGADTPKPKGRSLGDCLWAWLSSNSAHRERDQGPERGRSSSRGYPEDMQLSAEDRCERGCIHLGEGLLLGCVSDRRSLCLRTQLLPDAAGRNVPALNPGSKGLCPLKAWRTLRLMCL